MSLNYKVDKYFFKIALQQLKINRVLQLVTIAKSSVESLSPFFRATAINFDNGHDQVCTIPVLQPGWYLNTGSDVTVKNTCTQNQSFKSHPS